MSSELPHASAGGLQQGPFATPLLNQIRRSIRERADPLFEFLKLGEPAFVVLPGKPSEWCVALVATADFHRRGDPAFASLESPLGDTSFRKIGHTWSEAELDLSAPYVDQKYIAKDPEVALPRRALDALVAEGVVGRAAPHHYSFAQGIVRPLPGLIESAAAAVQQMQSEGVQAVVLLPTCSLCVQTVSLLARELERSGFATVCLSVLPELSQHVGTPRTLTIKFPFGAPAGDPHNSKLQVAVLCQALSLLSALDRPNQVVASELRWRR